MFPRVPNGCLREHCSTIFGLRAKRSSPAATACSDAGIEERIRALDRMTTGELADEYERLHRRECRTRHRGHLIRRPTSACPSDAGHA